MNRRTFIKSTIATPVLGVLFPRIQKDESSEETQKPTRITREGLLDAMKKLEKARQPWEKVRYETNALFIGVQS